jgi:GH25 family lysozyme M1 (1,4-beta-N-acetylmuramidase)
VGLSTAELTAIAEAFCDRVEAAGYQSMIYGNEYDLMHYRHESLVSNRIWWAEYGDTTPDFSIGIDMWQYSNSGSVDGISTVVDMNIDLSNAID